MTEFPTYPVVHEYQVGVEYQPFIQSIYTFSCAAPSKMPGTIVPDSQVEHIYYLSGSGEIRQAKTDVGWQPMPRAVAFLQSEYGVEVRTSSNCRYLAFRTNLATAQIILGMQATEAHNRMIDLDELCAHEAEAFIDLLKRLPPEHWGTATCQYVGKRLRSAPIGFARHVHLYDWMLANGHTGTIAEHAKNIGFARRTLERKFHTFGGTSPKAIARKGRFLQAVALLKQQPPEKLSYIAYALGYADQSHLHHDFQAFVKMTPGELLRRGELHYVRPVELLTAHL